MEAEVVLDLAGGGAVVSVLRMEAAKADIWRLRGAQADIWGRQRPITVMMLGEEVSKHQAWEVI